MYGLLRLAALAAMHGVAYAQLQPVPTNGCTSMTYGTVQCGGVCNRTTPSMICADCVDLTDSTGSGRSDYSVQTACSRPLQRADSRAAVPASWTTVPDRICGNSGYITLGKGTADLAIAACEADATCLYIDDSMCDNEGNWMMCSDGGEPPNEAGAGSCMYRPATTPAPGSSSSASTTCANVLVAAIVAAAATY